LPEALLHLDPEWLKSIDLHLHIPQHGIPKDGPSAGVTMFTAVASLVLQNPIGLSDVNRVALDAEFDRWADEVRRWPNVDASLLPDFRKRMFGGDFIFSVTREFVRTCAIPMLLMPGNDLVHAPNVSDDLALAPNVDVLTPWKGVELRDSAMQRVRGFLESHTP